MLIVTFSRTRIAYDSKLPETYDIPFPEIISWKAFATSKPGFSKLLKSYPNAVSPMMSNV